MRKLTEGAKPVTRNLLWGLAYGFGAACFFCVITVVFFIIAGSGVFEKNSTTFGSAMIGYLLSGLTAGAALGLLRPLTKYWVGAAFVGGICTAIAYGVLYASTRRDVGSSMVEVMLFFGVVFGPAIGVITKYRWAKMTREHEEVHGKIATREGRTS